MLLVKHHPFVKDRPAIPSGERILRIRHFRQSNDRGCVNRSRCMHIRLSSLVFEYSLFERPMVIFRLRTKRNTTTGAGFIMTMRI